MVRFDALEDVEVPLIRSAASRKQKSRNKRKAAELPIPRYMIAWDGEGIKLSGATAPQHYVLYGCSARLDDPLVIESPDDTLDFQTLAEYMLETSVQHPRAFHVGYAFKYDQNMIIRTLRWRNKIELYEHGETRATFADGAKYKIAWVPGKKLEIFRIAPERAYIKIEDIFGFFATSFVRAYTSTFPDAHDDPTFQKVIEGKNSRADTKWEDMPTIREYWHHEIIALERLAEGFKSMLWENGFRLSQWYGPGAFANYIRRENNLVDHEYGGKESNLPNDTIHHAIKCAYYGGHFEQYKAGRIQGPIYQYDINSAYPAAFTELPTLREGGFWQRIPYAELETDARAPSSVMSVYYVRFRGPRRNVLSVHEPMPFPYRDERGNVSYDIGHQGWYWAPEVTAVVNSQRWADYDCYVSDGWRWIPADDSRPWRDTIQPMYDTRLELKAAGNPAQMVFKLGPNSLYGKMAQRIGYNKDTLEPPKAHTLCIAGFLTSYCRGMILRIMDAMTDDQLIAVETDGVYTTAPPDQIKQGYPDFVVSKQLGEWGMETYDEIVYIQNGVYLVSTGDEWETKTRGINKSLLPPDKALAYVDTCLPSEPWEPLLIDGGEAFLGIGTAIMRSTQPNGTLIASKANRIHCAWFPDQKIVEPAGSMKSKRIHASPFCEACERGLKLSEGAHQLFIHLRLSGGRVKISAPYRLPWETREVEQWRSAMHHLGSRDRQVGDGREGQQSE